MFIWLLDACPDLDEFKEDTLPRFEPLWESIEVGWGGIAFAFFWLMIAGAFIEVKDPFGRPKDLVEVGIVPILPFSL